MPQTSRRQVAAICYRRISGGIEFLLVRSSAGRWTFPKGNLAPGEPPHMEAAREAFEEAGAIGICERQPLASYWHVKASGTVHCAVAAFLFEVVATGDAPEFGRAPTWFQANEARERLADGRSLRPRRELVRVIDVALRRLERLRYEPQRSA